MQSKLKEILTTYTKEELERIVLEKERKSSR